MFVNDLVIIEGIIKNKAYYKKLNNLNSLIKGPIRFLFFAYNLLSINIYCRIIAKYNTVIFQEVTMTTQEKIINIATQEFLNNGYQTASLRKIAKAAQVTTGAMYGYYKSKEELFNNIVVDVGDKFKEYYLTKGIDKMIIDYIYQNFEIFRLIICCSKETRYEEYLDHLVDEKVQQLKEQGFDDKLSHIINHSYLFGVFEIIRHQMSKKQAEKFVDDLQEFYQAGWNKLLERKEM